MLIVDDISDEWLSLVLFAVHIVKYHPTSPGQAM